jgi:hypothetical protein
MTPPRFNCACLRRCDSRTRCSCAPPSRRGARWPAGKARALFAEEQREAERLLARVAELEQTEGSVANVDDQEWLRRDMALVDAALLSGTATLDDALAEHEVAAVQDHDPYTRAHLHFAAHEITFANAVLRADQPGAIVCDIWRNCGDLM